MVKIMATPVTLPEAGFCSYCDEAEELDPIADAGDSRNALLGRRLLADPLTCVFWCAVALGALVKGRSVKSVSAVIYSVVVGCLRRYTLFPWTRQ